MEDRVRIAVGIATAGRPAILRAAVEQARNQTRAADLILVSAPSEADAAEAGVQGAGCELLVGQRGLTRQRNEIIARAGDFDLLVFFDDDFLPDARYLARVEEVFAAYPQVVLTTGTVIKDGIIGPGLSVAEGLDCLAAASAEAGGVATRDPAPSIRDVYNAYGCNMAVRLSVLQRSGILFDEMLPLYGWLEDVDFSRRLAKHGRIVQAIAAMGVHLGVKRGRQPGLPLGYSQIANPAYLIAKGSMAWHRALPLVARNIAMNVTRAMKPEPHVDRLGRLTGNILALRDLVIGKLRPQRILGL